MPTKFALSLLVLAVSALTSHAQVTNIWMAGRDDGGWPLTGTTGGPDANFVQENGGINPLPGSATSTAVPRGADNDYYFAGIYNTVLPANSAFYGPYTQNIGLVSAHENSAERAFAAADLDLRYHFNLSAGQITGNLFSISFEPLNLDTDNGTVDPADDPQDPRHGVEVYFNGVLVMPQLVFRTAELNQRVTTPLFDPVAAGAVAGPGADNIVSLKGYNYSTAAPTGGNWMGVDYVQMDAQVIPEPSTAMMLIFGAIGAAPFLRRRRG